jgi:hypothetical protein
MDACSSTRPRKQRSSASRWTATTVGARAATSWTSWAEDRDVPREHLLCDAVEVVAVAMRGDHAVELGDHGLRWERQPDRRVRDEDASTAELEHQFRVAGERQSHRASTRRYPPKKSGELRVAGLLFLPQIPAILRDSQ